MTADRTIAAVLAAGVLWLVLQSREAAASSALDQHRINALAGQIDDPTPESTGAEGDFWA